MRILDLITKKKAGQALTEEEIRFVVEGYTDGTIADYQVSSLLMAIIFQGMNEEETAALTMAMVHSGEVIDLSEINGIKVDKHSTGGVGDKISLIVAPLVASLGVPVAKMSGRGLGHTGGTLDKLESIAGFSIHLTTDEFINHVNDYKIALIGQTENLVPADKKLYALRDVTGTVDSIPLIASSIMSKKIAMGADAIVLDVKVGDGAFMKTVEEAEKLAKTMVQIGKSLKRNTVALLTNMNEPLGYEIGNANEIKEVVEFLNGKHIADLKEISFAIATRMCLLSGLYDDEEVITQKLNEAISSKKALDKFKQFISVQGGDVACIEDVSLLPQAKNHVDVLAAEEGYIHTIEAEKIGVAATLLGAGRQKKSDTIDYSAGVTLVKKIGDYVKKAEVIAVLHTNKTDIEAAKEKIASAFYVQTGEPDKVKYVHKLVD